MARGMTEALRQAVAGTELDPEQQREEVETPEEPTEAIEASEQEETTEEAGQEPEQEAIEYVNDLPEAMGWDPEDFYSMKLKLSSGPDGESREVPFGEIKDRLQAAEQERAQLAQDRANLDAQARALAENAQRIGQQQTAVTAEMQQAGAELNALQQAMPALEQDWAKREETEPGKVALERQRIQQRMQQAGQRHMVAKQHAEHLSAQGRQQWLQQQSQQLGQMVPEWNDPQERPKIQQAVANFAQQVYGVSPGELAGIDARTVKMMIDAMHSHLVRQKTGKAVEGAKKAKTVAPRKGVRLKSSSSRQARADQLTQQARKSRSKQDITAAIRSVIASGR